MNSVVLMADEAVQQEIHSLKSKINMRNLSNQYYGYWSTKSWDKRADISLLPKFQQFSSEHRYSVSLPERAGVVGIAIVAQCDFSVWLRGERVVWVRVPRGRAVLREGVGADVALA